MIKGAYLINNPAIADDRGFSRVVFKKNELEQLIHKSFRVVQQYHSSSVKGTLRGIHVAPYSKLFYVAKGLVQVMIVDCRKESATYKKVNAMPMGQLNGQSLFVPAGCGIGFLVLSQEAECIYLTDGYWVKDKEFGIAWNDPMLEDRWLSKNPLLSEKDKNNKSFKDL